MKGIAAGVALVLLGASFAGAAILVNINTADSATLETLNGIGPSKAQAIIDYRTQHGPFAKIEDIMNVSGIGTATYNNIKDSITVGDTTQTTETTQTQSQTDTQSQNTSQSTSQAQTQAPVISYVAPPVPEVFVDAGQDRTVIVGADTRFDARAYDKDQTVLDLTRFMWNFGDGSTTEGMSVLHHYEYPGRYALIVQIAHDRSSASDQVVVTAEPPKLGFAARPDGSAEIQNLAGRDLDLSGWMVRSLPGQMSNLFALPPRSIILSGGSMRLPRATLGFGATDRSELAYPNGVTVLHAGESTGAAPADSSSVNTPRATAGSAASSPASPQPMTSGLAPAPSAAFAQDDTTSEASTPDAGEESPGEVAASAAGSSDDSRMWWLAAAALAAAAGGSLVAARRLGKKEWAIIEE